MSHDLFKKQVYSGLLEILKDSKFYYYSHIGERYCKFTEEGEKALMEYLAVMGPWIIDRERKELDRKAKQLVIEELKK